MNYGVCDAGVCVQWGSSVVALDRLGLDAPPGLFAHRSLNPFMTVGPSVWESVAEQLAAADLSSGVVADAALHMPFEVADYVDFYASIDHATNVGRVFRPDNPLLPNWRHLPVGYHGRAGTVVVSDTAVSRPTASTRAQGDFGPTQRLDFELELAFVVGVPSTLGSPVPIDDAARHVFGVTLLNDWSAATSRPGSPPSPVLGQVVRHVDLALGHAAFRPRPAPRRRRPKTRNRSPTSRRVSRGDWTSHWKPR